MAWLGLAAESYSARSEAKTGQNVAPAWRLCFRAHADPHEYLALTFPSKSLDAARSTGNSRVRATDHVPFTLGEPMRRPAFAIYAACLLFALPAFAQDQEKQPLVPRRPLFKVEKQTTPPTVAEALKSLGAITVGDVRAMPDSDLRQLTDLLKQWTDIAAIEEKRREEGRKGKGGKSP
jgi:hypothetical protein